MTIETPTSENPKKPKIRSLKIFQPKRCIIVEHIDVEDGYETIRKGSTLNCGACGGYIGTMQASLEFPFTLHQFKSRVQDINFKTGKFGLICGRRSCKAHLFTNLKDLVFTTFDNFRKTQEVVMEESKKYLKEYNRKMKIQNHKNKLLRLYMKIRKPFRWIRSWFFFFQKKE